MALDTLRRRIVSIVTSPPGWRFHSLLIAFALAALYGFSFAGVHVIAALLAAFGLTAAGIVWMVRLVGFLTMRARRSTIGNAKWFALAPLGAAVVAALLWAEVPLRVRWAASRGAFEEAAHVVERDVPTEVSRSFNRRLGLYRVTSVWRVETGVIFYDAAGSILNYAGFAYLPDGPSGDLANGNFENPQFRSLGGGWYAWTASW